MVETELVVCSAVVEIEVFVVMLVVVVEVVVVMFVNVINVFETKVEVRIEPVDVVEIELVIFSVVVETVDFVVVLV